MTANIAPEPASLPVRPEQVPSPSRRQRVFATWMADILIYVVVLNLYVEYSEAKMIESFTISILTAVVLKVLLVGITAAKLGVWSWSKSKDSSAFTVLGVVGVWAILFLSKFLILAVEDAIFGSLVELGTFVDVMLLVAGLIITREIVQRMYVRLG